MKMKFKPGDKVMVHEEAQGNIAADLIDQVGSARAGALHSWMTSKPVEIVGAEEQGYVIRINRTKFDGLVDGQDLVKAKGTP